MQRKSQISSPRKLTDQFYRFKKSVALLFLNNTPLHLDLDYNIMLSRVVVGCCDYENLFCTVAFKLCFLININPLGLKYIPTIKLETMQLWQDILITYSQLFVSISPNSNFWLKCKCYEQWLVTFLSYRNSASCERAEQEAHHRPEKFSLGPGGDPISSGAGNMTSRGAWNRDAHTMMWTWRVVAALMKTPPVSAPRDGDGWLPELPRSIVSYYRKSLSNKLAQFGS